jgi:hypothetical protein
MEHRDRLKKSAQSWPRRKGKREYLDFLDGKSLTRQEAIDAMCFSCDPEGGEPCRVTGCSLTLFNPRNVRAAKGKDRKSEDKIP